MKKLLSKANRLKKVLAFVLCSALVLGEVPAGIIKADSDEQPDPKIVLEGSVNEQGKITLTAKVVNAAVTTGSYEWLQVDRSTGNVDPTQPVLGYDASMSLDALYELWKPTVATESPSPSPSPKLLDSTNKIRIVSHYADPSASPSPSESPAPDVEVKGDYGWKVNDAKDEAELEIDSFEGVSAQKVSTADSTNGNIINLKNGMKILDESGQDVTSNNGLLSKGEYVVALTYSGTEASITVKAEYKIEVETASESSAPSVSPNPSAAPTEVATATAQPTEEPPFINPTQTPDIWEPPVEQPTAAPTVTPAPMATPEPGVTAAPTATATAVPTEPTATKAPEADATVKPADPTKAPDADATAKPADPTKAPAADPTVKPADPTVKPADPTAAPDADKNNTVTVGKAEFKVNTKSKSVAYEGTAATGKKVTVPATVKVNGVSYPVTSVSDGAFKNSKVTSVKLGKNVTTVGKNAFKGCKKLTKVTFPAKLQKVEAGAFTGCTKLKAVSLPAATKTIGAKAFKNCKSLKKITIGQAPKKTRKAQILFGSYNQGKTLFAAPASAKVSIGASALENCVKLRSVIINSQVTKIGSKTFQHCKELARVLVKSLKLRAVGNNALKGVNNCKISVPTIRLRKYRTLFKNKGQGRKVVIAKA